MSVLERARPSILRVLSDLALALYDLEWTGGVLRVTITGPEGVDLDAIATVTRMVSRELDHLDLAVGAYTLEVSSPGLERTLRSPDHFRGALSSTITLRTHPTVEGERRTQGTLIAVDDEGITVQAEGDGERSERRLSYRDIERARTVFVWGSAPAAAKHRAGATTRKATR